MTPKLTIDPQDLKALYVHTKFAYGKGTYEDWIKGTKKSYEEYFNASKNPKSFSQWVNDQIIALT